MLPYDFCSGCYPVLYHYTSISAAGAMIESRTFWLSEYELMNDVSEFTYARDRLISLVMYENAKVSPVAAYSLLTALDGLREQTGMLIGSLTTRRDDLSQRRAYGGNGAGCVVGIDAQYLQNSAGVQVRTVIYDERKIEALLMAGLSVLEKEAQKGRDNWVELIDCSRRLVTDLFAIKHPSFSDEREVRISRMLVGGSQDSVEDVGGHRSDGRETPRLPVATRQSAFGQTRYVALPLQRDDGTSAIVSVGLGPAMEMSEREKSHAYFEKTDLQVWNSLIPYRVR